MEARSGRSPFAVRDRLRELSDRFTGSKVIHMRQDPVPWAYRVFFRQVGVDPDSDRTPVERIAVERLEWGGLRSQNLLDDALVIATVETGVPVIAFDADKVGRPPRPAAVAHAASSSAAAGGHCRRARSWWPTRTGRCRCSSARSPRSGA